MKLLLAKKGRALFARRMIPGVDHFGSMEQIRKDSRLPVWVAHAPVRNSIEGSSSRRFLKDRRSQHVFFSTCGSSDVPELAPPYGKVPSTTRFPRRSTQSRILCQRVLDFFVPPTKRPFGHWLGGAFRTFDAPDPDTCEDESSEICSGL